MSRLNLTMISSSLNKTQEDNLSFSLQQAFETHVLNSQEPNKDERKEIFQQKLNEVLEEHGFADNKANLALNWDAEKCVAELVIHF